MARTQAARLTLEVPVRVAAAPRPQPLQPRVVAAAVLLVLTGAGWLATRYGLRQGGLFLVGVGCGLVLYHAAFGFTSAFRALVTTGDGRGLRAQMLMLALATVLFAPMLASGQALGMPVGGALAPAGVSVLVGALIFGIGMQLGGG